MNHAIDRRIELEAEKAELEKAIHVIWSSPEPVSPTLRQSVEGYEAHLHGVKQELRIREEK